MPRRRMMTLMAAWVRELVTLGLVPARMLLCTILMKTRTMTAAAWQIATRRSVTCKLWLWRRTWTRIWAMLVVRRSIEARILLPIYVYNAPYQLRKHTTAPHYC